MARLEDTEATGRLDQIVRRFEAKLLADVSLPPAESRATYGELLRRGLTHLGLWPPDSKLSQPHLLTAIELMQRLEMAVRTERAQLQVTPVELDDASVVLERSRFVAATAATAHYVAGELSRRRPSGDSTAWLPWRDSIPRQAEDAAEAIDRTGQSRLLAAALLPSLLSSPAQAWLAAEPETAFALLQRLDTTRAVTSVTEPRRVGEGRAETQPQSSLANHRSPSTPAKGWGYWAWLAAAVESQHVEVNTVDSLVHGLDGGALLLVVPDCFEAYAAIDETPPKRVQNQVMRLKRHCTRADGRNLYGAAIGKTRCRGLIFDDAQALIGREIAPSPVLKLL